MASRKEEIRDLQAIREACPEVQELTDKLQYERNSLTRFGRPADGFIG
jgi:hypothetical protein